MFITREELRVMLDVSESASNPSTIDRKRIRRIIRFGDTTVGEAMIPLADVVGVNEARPMKEAVRLVMKHGFNRLPVYRGNITNIKSMMTLSSWDLMDPDIMEKAAVRLCQRGAVSVAEADHRSGASEAAGETGSPRRGRR